MVISPALLIAVGRGKWIWSTCMAASCRTSMRGCG